MSFVKDSIVAKQGDQLRSFNVAGSAVFLRKLATEVKCSGLAITRSVLLISRITAPNRILSVNFFISC